MQCLKELQQLPDETWYAHGIVMGGPWQIRFWLSDGISNQPLVAQEIAHSAFLTLLRIDNLMSPYGTDNDITHASQAPLNEWQSISFEFAQVLLKAQQIARISNNALDVTLGAAINHWGFGPKPNNRDLLPNHQNQQYEVRLTPPSVRRLDNIQFNVCALAKGYAVDLVAQLLKNKGIKNFLIEATGEVIACGKRIDGLPWQIGLELPIPHKILVYDQVPLYNRALASSGSYRKFHKIGNKTISHTLNPRTQEPLEGNLLSVTVCANDCISADALATVLLVKGMEAGSAWAHERGIAAVFMAQQAEEICELRTQAWIDLFTKN